MKRLIPLLALGIILYGCNIKPLSENPKYLSGISSYSTVIESKGKSYQIIFSPKKGQIPLNQYFDMDVQIKGAMGQTLKFPVKLSIDAGMEIHNHGMNSKPIIESLGQGKYKVSGLLFHMSGEWFLEFSIQRGLIFDKTKITLEVST
jgi:hypothetical protein